MAKLKYVSNPYQIKKEQGNLYQVFHQDSRIIVGVYYTSFGISIILLSASGKAKYLSKYVPSEFLYNAKAVLYTFVFFSFVSSF